jgi:hypothetical protein
VIDTKYYEERVKLYEEEEDQAADDLLEDGFEDGLVLIQVRIPVQSLSRPTDVFA